MSELASIGVVGMAVMGSNLARNFANHGHKVAIFNRSYEKTEKVMAERGSSQRRRLRSSSPAWRSPAGS